MENYIINGGRTTIEIEHNTIDKEDLVTITNCQLSVSDLRNLINTLQYIEPKLRSRECQAG